MRLGLPHSSHTHQLRHTFAVSFLKAGGDVFSLQYLLGHSTLAVTQRYLQSLNADDAVKKRSAQYPHNGVHCA
ncbi:tyrosine-type recombinase/integrase [Chloroflexota bacterium]